MLRKGMDTDMCAERRKKPELLIPAGSLEVLKTAVIYGADAVYIGGEAFGLRAKAKNFSPPIFWLITKIWNRRGSILRNFAI